MPQGSLGTTVQLLLLSRLSNALQDYQPVSKAPTWHWHAIICLALLSSNVLMNPMNAWLYK